MKVFKSVIFASLILGLGVFASCKQGGEQAASEGTSTEQPATPAAAPHGESKEYTSAYVCPMHCQGSGSDAAGKCPACGMDYVAQADHVKDGHKHGEDHSGHTH